MGIDAGNTMYKTENVIQIPLEAYQRMARFFIFANDWITGSSVADLGAGSGESKHFIPSIDQYDYYPVEDSKFIDLNDVGTYPQKLYDHVILNHSLEHLSNPSKVLSNIADCLLIRSDWSKVLICVPLAHPNNAHRPFDTSIGHVSSFTESSLYDIVNERFTVKQTGCVSFGDFMEIYCVGGLRV